MNETKSLTPNEERVLYGIICYPEKTDKELASLLQMKDSTLTSIKKRLEQNNYYSLHYIPQLNRLGVELLGIIFTSFNPTIDFEDRVKITKEKIEIAQEIFYSVGAPEMGFSLSFTKNYSTFCAINETRTETFGEKGLLEKEFPHEVIFPFSISSIDEFFDYSRLLYNHFSRSLHGIKMPPPEVKPCFNHNESIKLNEKEKKVLIALIADPKATMQQIGDKVELSRHTVARIKKKFLEQDILRIKAIPNLDQIGFKLLVFYHLKFTPTTKINDAIIQELNSHSTLFCAHRKFNAVIISAYPEYSDYKEDKVKKLTYLKENNLINYTPSPRKYVFNQMKVIKNFTFYDITKKILESS